MRLPGVQIGFYRATFHNLHFLRGPFYVKDDMWTRVVANTIQGNPHEFAVSSRDYRTMMSREGKGIIMWTPP